MGNSHNGESSSSKRIGLRRVCSISIMARRVVYSSCLLTRGGCCHSHGFGTGRMISSAFLNVQDMSYRYREYHPNLGKPSAMIAPEIIIPKQISQRSMITSALRSYHDDNSSLIKENSSIDSWRDNPSISETFEIPTISVPSEHVHALLSRKEGVLSAYLASHVDEFVNVHPRVKLVREIEEESLKGRKVILLDPKRVNDKYDKSSLPPSTNIEEDRTKHQQLKEAFPGINDVIIESLTSFDAQPGPPISVTLPYTQQPIQRILSKLLPPEAQPPPTSYEQIGHVVHLNLKSHHLAYRKVIGEVILDRLKPKIQTVVNKVGEVSGPYRTYDMEVLAGEPETMVTVIEDGVSLQFDLSKVYWCTRLSGERSRMIQDDFHEGDIIADAFCGAGALCLLAAKKLGCHIYANDLNPDAVHYARKNAKRNGIRGTTFDVNCGDAFDFIQNMGMMERLPNHVIMNFPLDSTSFLGAFRWWPNSFQDEDIVTKVHLYTFARGDDSNASSFISKSDNSTQETIATPRNAIDVAIDLVADGLLPEGGAIERGINRRSDLDNLGCEVSAREIRDVAPGKVVVHISFKVTSALVNVMQGNFLVDY